MNHLASSSKIGGEKKENIRSEPDVEGSRSRRAPYARVSVLFEDSGLSFVFFR